MFHDRFVINIMFDLSLTYHRLLADSHTQSFFIVTNISDQNVRPASNSKGVDPDALNNVWRSFYFIGGIFVSMVLLYRFLIADEGTSHHTIQERKKCRTHKLTFAMIFHRYWARLIATGGCWFVWDIVFYGLKLFSGPIFASIDPAGDLVTRNGYLLVNNIIALVGYYAAALIIDFSSIGRKNVQIVFFTLVGIVFLIMSFIFETASPQVNMCLFFLTSFLGQFVNMTTYVVCERMT
jgi:hypothetical protein